MPSRVIRDGLLDSESVAALHDKTFRMYMALILMADDFGLVPIDFGSIKRATAMLEWTREMVAKMLGELVDAALIAPYESDGKPFAAIARWQSRVNCVRPKYPEPSFGMWHLLQPYQFKSEHVRIATSNYFKHLSADGVPLVCHSLPTSGTKGGRGKGEGIREKEKTNHTPATAGESSEPEKTGSDDQEVAVAYKVPPCPIAKIVSAYHAALPELPQMLVVNEPRTAHIRARWREVCADQSLGAEEGLAWFADFFASIKRSKFLTGRAHNRDPNRKPFVADLEWLMRPTNFVKVFEGKYE